MKPMQSSAGQTLQRISRMALTLGVLLLLPCLFWLTRDPVQFERSYLLAFLFILAPAGGALALFGLYHLTGGRWGDALADILESALRSMPVLALLFVPILLGLGSIYPWAAEGWGQSGAISEHKQIFFRPAFFVTRTLAYFLVWIGLARLLLSTKREASSNRSRGRAAAALLIFVLTMTFAAFDWGMSLGPEWYSTMYGLILIVGQLLSALTLGILMRCCLDRVDRTQATDVDVWHDLGTLLFAFVMTWAYLGFSQFLIIWSANMPEEVTWYMERLAPGWKMLAGALVAVHFCVPFLLLLMRKVKRKPRYLAAVAGLLMAARLPELIWMIVPAFHPEQMRIHWLDIALPLALLSLWCGLVIGGLARRLGPNSSPLSQLGSVVTE